MRQRGDYFHGDMASGDDDARDDDDDDGRTMRGHRRCPMFHVDRTVWSVVDERVGTEMRK